MTTERAAQGPWLVGIGVALPVLVFAGLVLWRLLMSQDAPALQHDLLVASYQATSASGTHSSFYRVDDGRVIARVQPLNYPGAGGQVLLRLDHDSGRLTPVTHAEPELAETAERRWIDVPVLPNVRVSTDITAPDGWTFRDAYGRGPGVFGWLFRGSRRDAAELTRRGARRPLPAADASGYGALQFVGWVVSEDER